MGGGGGSESIMEPPMQSLGLRHAFCVHVLKRDYYPDLRKKTLIKKQTGKANKTYRRYASRTFLDGSKF